MKHNKPKNPTREPSKSRAGFALLLVFGLLAAGIVTTGYRYYRHHEQNYRAEVEHPLSAMADSKMGELAQGRKERLGDIGDGGPSPSRKGCRSHGCEEVTR